MDQTLQGSDGHSDPSSSERVATIVHQVMSHWALGESVDDAALCAAHPDLMPALAERLRLLREVEWARRRAREASSAPAAPGQSAEPFEESHRFLAEALPGYEILEQIHYGGQGVVFKAFQRAAYRNVAIKVLLDGPLATEQQRRRFEREVELVSRLRHPNIVSMHESGVVRGRHYCVMEFVEGLSIDDYVLIEDLTVPDVVRLFIEVCRAVASAHQRGVIHRDLNPANILVDLNGEPHVLDFGLAKDVWADSADPNRVALTATGQCVGTLPYLSPEQAAGLDAQIDVRTDVYALGVTLFRLLTGLFPYPIDGDAATVRHRIRAVEPLRLRKALRLTGSGAVRGTWAVNHDLELILLKAMEKDIERRYPSIAEFATDLERYMSGDAVAARVGSRLYTLRKALRRHRAIAAAAGLLFLIVTASSVTVTAFWIRARTQRDQARAAAGTAYDLFDLALTDLEEGVRPLAGGVAVRDRLLERLAERMPALERVVQTDASLRPIHARLLEKQGDLALQHGRGEEARQSYQGFLDETSRLVASSSDEPATAIRAYRKLAEVSDEPSDVFERGLAYGEAALARQPSAPASRYELCALLLSFGDGLRVAGRPESAVDRLERALQLCTFTDTEPPAGPWRRLEAAIHSAHGQALHKLGAADESRQALERAAALRAALVGANPADIEARMALMRSYEQLAIMHRDKGQSEPAIEYLRKAIEQSDVLAMMDPSSTAWERDRYGMHHRLASLYLEFRKTEPAMIHCEKAVTIAETWRARSDSDEATAACMHAHLLRSKAWRVGEKWDAAYRAAQEALTLARSLLERDPDNRTRLAEVVAACDTVASCGRRLGLLSETVAHRQEARELQSRLVGLEPEVVEHVFNLIRVQINLASDHVALGTNADRTRAAGLLADAERALQDLKASGRHVGWEQKHTALQNALYKVRVKLGSTSRPVAGPS